MIVVTERYRRPEWRKTEVGIYVKRPNGVDHDRATAVGTEVKVEDELMRYLPTRRVVAAVLAAAGMTGTLSLAMGQTQGPPPSSSQVVPDGRSSPPDRSRKVR